MKQPKSPQTRTLSLLVGTALLLLLTSFLILHLNKTYLREEAGRPNESIKRSESEQLAVLKTDSGIVSGQVTRSTNGERSFINVEINELLELKTNRSYLIYFNESENPGDGVLIAQLGEPQQINGQSKYILTGWGPKGWFDYDTVELREAGPASSEKVVLSGTFAAAR